MSSKDRNDTFGVGVRADFGRTDVDAIFCSWLARTEGGVLLIVRFCSALSTAGRVRIILPPTV